MSNAPLKEWMASRIGARSIGIATVVVLIGMVELAIRGGLVNRFIVPLPSEIIVAIPRIIVEENVLHRFWQTAQEVLWASLLLAGVGIHGLLAFTVSSRSQEIGVRLALGARSATIARMILARALLLPWPASFRESSLPTRAGGRWSRSSWA